MQNTSELTWHIDFETKHHEFVCVNDKDLEKVFDAITEAKQHGQDNIKATKAKRH